MMIPRLLFSIFAVVLLVSAAPAEPVERELTWHWPWEDTTYKLPCPVQPPSATVPTDANHVKFSDIKVAMAIGDSITAGFGMYEHLKITGFREFRGDVFSIGGNDGQPTIPNYLKTVNGGRAVVGPSSGDAEIPFSVFVTNNLEEHHPKEDHLNAAQSGAKIQDVPEMVEYLSTQLTSMEKDKKVNIKEDWKLLTILIGANNLCRGCNASLDGYMGADAFAEKLEGVLESVYDRFPRTLVNLLPMLNVSQVWFKGRDHWYCEWAWQHYKECPCMMENTVEAALGMDSLNVEYQARLRKIEASWAEKALPDFRVRLQPFLENLILPNETYVSGVDCFHPSAIAHQFFSVGLWNNMQEAPGEKSTEVLLSDRPKCPGANDYIQ